MVDVTTLTPGVVRIAQQIELDGRVSWVPPDVRGPWDVNRYVILGDGRAAMIDTGLACHRDELLRVVGDLLTDGRGLDLVITRAVSPECVGNAAALIDAFPDTRVITTNSLPTPDLLHGHRLFTDRHVAHGDSLAFDRVDELQFIEAPLKTLYTSWVFAPRSGVLFTSDAFGFPDHEQHPEVIRRYLLARHDWLERADPQPLADRLATCFERYDVRVIAPGTGAPIVGREAVRKLLDAVSAAIGTSRHPQPQPAR
jgi:flavorubredoxin